MRIAIVLALCTLPTTALADKAVAEAAFQQGKQLMKDGRLAEACAAFEKSEANDAERGTEYNLGLCYEASGRLASAWALYRELAQRDDNHARRADSGARAGAIEPRLIKLLITVEAPVDGLVITRNGEDITSAVGIQSPIDPGAYRIAARADGYQPWSVDVTAAQEGGTVQVTVPPLVAVPDAPSDAQPAPEVQIDRVAPPPARSDRRPLALWVGGAGLAVGAIGLGFGALASSRWDRAVALCGGAPDRCTATGADLTAAEDARARAALFGDASTAALGLGAAAIAAGAILYLTAPHAHVVATATSDGVALTAMGSF